MRIPILAIIPICLITIIVIWWNGTKEADFLTPPSQARLEEIRTETLASLPLSKIVPDNTVEVTTSIPTPDISLLKEESIKLIEPTEPTEPIEPIKVVQSLDLGDIESEPALDAYSSRAPDGADKLIELAGSLRKIGKMKHALIAYERVIDSSQGNPEQILTALTAIQEIRPILPFWNREEIKEFSTTINIGTGEKFQDDLPEMLTRITNTLSKASSGIISFDFKLNIGKSIQTIDAPTPVALWLTGPKASQTSSDVLSFTTDDPEDLETQILKTTFNLIRGELSKTTSYNPAPEALDDPLIALQSHITRLLWEEFGKALNKEK